MPGDRNSGMMLPQYHSLMACEVVSYAHGLQRLSVVSKFCFSCPIMFRGNYEEVGPLFPHSLSKGHLLDLSRLRNNTMVLPCRPLRLLHALLTFQGKYHRAEPLIERSVVIRKEALGPDHPQFATTLHNQALLWEAQVTTEEVLLVILRLNFVVVATGVYIDDVVR